MKLSSSDKKLIIILAGGTVLGGIILGIISRIGIPTASAEANLTRTETGELPKEVMMV